MSSQQTSQVWTTCTLKGNGGYMCAGYGPAGRWDRGGETCKALILRGNSLLRLCSWGLRPANELQTIQALVCMDVFMPR